MERILFLAATLLLTVYGQLVVKARAAVHASQTGDDRVRFLAAMFLDVWVISALAAAVAAGAAWMLAVRTAQLSQIYPFVALTFVLVPLGAAMMFGDKISVLQAVGLALIVLGVALAVRPA